MIQLETSWKTNTKTECQRQKEATVISDQCSGYRTHLVSWQGYGEEARGEKCGAVTRQGPKIGKCRECHKGLEQQTCVQTYPGTQGTTAISHSQKIAISELLFWNWPLKEHAMRFFLSPANCKRAKEVDPYQIFWRQSLLSDHSLHGLHVLSYSIISIQLHQTTSVY